MRPVFDTCSNKRATIERQIKASCNIATISVTRLSGQGSELHTKRAETVHRIGCGYHPSSMEIVEETSSAPIENQTKIEYGGRWRKRQEGLDLENDQHRAAFLRANLERTRSKLHARLQQTSTQDPSGEDNEQTEEPSRQTCVISRAEERGISLPQVVRPLECVYQLLVRIVVERCLRSDQTAQLSMAGPARQPAAASSRGYEPLPYS